MTARLLMIGLDGADGASLDRWSADGTLPNLAALRRRGRLRHLTSLRGSTDDALWASFQYAQGPGEHGRYNYRQRIAPGKMRMPHTTEVDREIFWDLLSREGQRVAIIDVPKCRVPRALNGIHLADWLVHGHYFRAPQSYPPELAAETVERFGPAPPSRCSYVVPPLSDTEVNEIAHNLRDGIAKKRAVGLHYIATEPWDLFVIAFKEGHCAGHMLWDFADPLHTRYDAARSARLGDPVRTIFRDLDAAVGDLVAAAGPEASVVVFSTTDMKPNRTIIHLMPGVVARLNQMLGDKRAATALPSILGRIARRVLLAPCEILPYGENAVALHINSPHRLFGRAAARTARITAVESALRELTDADTGVPVIVAVDRPSTTQKGARASLLPDLLAHLGPGATPRALVSPRLGRIEAAVPSLRPGNHASGGLAFLTGAAAGLADGINSLEDFAPLAAKVLHAESSVLAAAR